MSLYVSDVMGNDGDDGDDGDIENEELLLSSLSLSTVSETRRRAVIDGCVPLHFEEVGGLRPAERKSSWV